LTASLNGTCAIQAPILASTPLCSIEPAHHWSRASKNPLLKG